MKPKSKKRKLLLILLPSGVVLFLVMITLLYYSIPFKKVDDMVFAANSKEISRYEDGSAFVDYDDYVKLKLFDDVDSPRQRISTSCKIKIKKIKVDSIEYQVSYTVKKRDINDYSNVIDEKESTCEIYFYFDKLKWQVSEIAILPSEVPEHLRSSTA